MENHKNDAVIRQRWTHFVCAQNLKMFQSLACEFLTDFPFYGPKIGILKFRELNIPEY